MSVLIQWYESFRYVNEVVQFIHAYFLIDLLYLIQAGGLGPITYPLLSDFNKKIARDYDVLVEIAGVALRGLFIIDPKVQYPPQGPETQGFVPLGNIKTLLQSYKELLQF
jgi:hypothetical protein